MKKFFLLSMLFALMNMMGVSPVFADSGDSADDPLNLSSGTCSFSWAGNNIWFKAVVPAGRTLITTPSEGTIQADIYECYDDIASESYTTKTFNSTTPLKYENAEDTDATIYVKVKNVLNVVDVAFSTWFDFVETPSNLTWDTATEIEEGTLTVGPLDKENNAPLWYKLVVPAGTKVTMQKNYPHTVSVYAGDANAEAGNFITGIFMYGNTKATWTNNASEAVNLYVQFYSTSGIAPYTMTFTFEGATPDAGSAWNYPIEMTEGANKILAIGDTHDPMWYACKVPGRTKVTFTNDYWDIKASFYEGDDAAKADAEPEGSAFGAASTKTFENTTSTAETIYMKVVYSQGFAQYAQVSVAFEDLPGAATADKVAGEYKGTYSLDSAVGGAPAGYTGSLEDAKMTVTKASDTTVDITLPECNLGLPFASYTIKNIAVAEDGTLSGGDLGDESYVVVGTGWGSASAFSVTGTLDGTNANVTINITASTVAGASEMVMSFKTPAPSTADKVVGDYTGTYSLDSAVGGAPAGYTGSLDDAVMTVTKASDTTVDITLPECNLSLPFASYTIKNIAVAEDGTLSGGDLGDESYVVVGTGWGSASAFSVTGTLDGTNANVTINITASTVAGASEMVMSFKTGSAAPATADAVVGDYTGTYSLDSAVGGAPAGYTGSLDDAVMTVTKASDTTVDITLPECSLALPFASYTIKNVAVDAEGNLSGGDLGGEEYVVVGTGWGSASAFNVTGTLDGTNANVTINITASTVAGASEITMSFVAPTPAPATADAVVGDYTGRYSLVGAEGGAPAGYTGSLDDAVMTVTKASDTTVDITLPECSLALPFASYTIKNVAVDAEGNLSGGDLGGEEYVVVGTGWGSASAFNVTGTLDGTNANVTINITASTVAGASEITMSFVAPTPAPATADAVVGDYTGTYSLDGAEGGAPAGYTAALNGETMTVTKASDTTVDITLPECSLALPFACYTIKNVAVDAEGNLSGGDLGGEEYVVVGTGWGSANAFSVTGTLDGTNANVTINISATTVAGASEIAMSFKAGTFDSISTISTKTDGETYNLQGVRVNDNFKGIIIKNGKKYLNK